MAHIPEVSTTAHSSIWIVLNSQFNKVVKFSTNFSINWSKFSINFLFNSNFRPIFYPFLIKLYFLTFLIKFNFLTNISINWSKFSIKFQLNSNFRPIVRSRFSAPTLKPISYIFITCDFCESSMPITSVTTQLLRIEIVPFS